MRIQDMKNKGSSEMTKRGKASRTVRKQNKQSRPRLKKPVKSKTAESPAKTVPAGVDHTPRPRKALPEGVKPIGLKKTTRTPSTPVDVCRSRKKNTKER